MEKFKMRGKRTKAETGAAVTPEPKPRKCYKTKGEGGLCASTPAPYGMITKWAKEYGYSESQLRGILQGKRRVVSRPLRRTLEKMDYRFDIHGFAIV